MKRVLEGFLQAQTSTSKFVTRGSSSWERRLNSLEEQPTMSPEGCRAEMPWKCDCLEDAKRMAGEAMVNNDVLATKALEGMTAWMF